MCLYFISLIDSLNFQSWQCQWVPCRCVSAAQGRLPVALSPRIGGDWLPSASGVQPAPVLWAVCSSASLPRCPAADLRPELMRRGRLPPRCPFTSQRQQCVLPPPSPCLLSGGTASVWLPCRQNRCLLAPSLWVRWVWLKNEVAGTAEEMRCEDQARRSQTDLVSSEPRCLTGCGVTGQPRPEGSPLGNVVFPVWVPCERMGPWWSRATVFQIWVA